MTKLMETAFDFSGKEAFLRGIRVYSIERIAAITLRKPTIRFAM